MQYRQLLNQILRVVPRPSGASADQLVKDIIHSRRLECASRHNWSFMLREGVARNSGGYRDGVCTVTQNSRTLTLTTGTLPNPCAGFHFMPSSGTTERYRIVTRSSGTVAVLDRPYEGDTKTGLACIIWDPYCLAPRDLFRWKSLRFEYGGKVVPYEDGAYFDAYWPDPRNLATDVSIATIAQPSTAARYETGTVTLTKGSATVTLATGTWPEWCTDRHLKFQGEPELYKVKTRDSDTQVTLTRAYGGKFAGSSISYELDPPGCIQLEVMGPMEDQYTLKIRYYAEPERLVNDADLVEGPEAYQQAIISLCQADYIMGNLPDAGMDGQSPAYIKALNLAKEKESQGERLILSLIGHTVPPEQHCRMRLWHRMGSIQ